MNYQEKKQFFDLTRDEITHNESRHDEMLDRLDALRDAIEDASVIMLGLGSRLIPARRGAE